MLALPVHFTCLVFSEMDLSTARPFSFISAPAHEAPQGCCVGRSRQRHRERMANCQERSSNALLKTGDVPVLAHSSDSADSASGTLCLHPEEKPCADKFWDHSEHLYQFKSGIPACSCKD